MGDFQFAIERGKAQAKAKVAAADDPKARARARTVLWMDPGVPRESKGDHIDLGSGREASVVLNDPVVQEQHALIRLSEGRFWIEDAQTPTGTYRNGLMVAEREALEHDDELVLGTSRVRVQLLDAGVPLRTSDGRPLLRLLLEEASFAFVPKTAALFKGLSPEERRRVEAMDTKDQWVHAETVFGRSRALQIVACIAAGAAALAPFSLFASRGRELVSPGELSAKHTAGLQAPQGCADCHAAFHGPTVERCGACHCDVLEASRHPFLNGREAAFARASGECEVCHREHQGPVIATAEAAASCTASRCHAEDEMLPDRILDSLKKRVLPGRESTSRPVAVEYNEFSHASHLKQGLDIRCVECHEAREGEAREFARVRFEACMKKCHGPEAQDKSLQRWPAADHRNFGWVVRWHGRQEDKCLQCHDKQGLDRGVLKRDTTPDHGPLSFDVERRRHQPQFELAHGDAEHDCAQCHKEGSVAPREGKGAPFWHGLHLDALDPAPSAVKRVLEECVECHTEASTSDTLAKMTAPGVSTEEQQHCGACHKDEDDRPLDLSAALPDATGARDRVDFPHDRHLKVEGGCLACHRFSPAQELQSALPETVLDPDCKRCHENHEQIAGGACGKCHGFKDERWVVDRSEPRRFSAYRGDVLIKDWRNGGVATPASHEAQAECVMTFSHFGTEGHRKSAANGKCDACHSLEGLTSAQQVLEVPIPQETSQGCRKCHVVQRQRFHWE